MNLLVAILIFSLIYYLIKKDVVGSKRSGVAKSHRSKSADRDAWGGNFWDTTNQIDVKAVLRIDYTDAENQRTIREIEVNKIGDIGSDKMIMAHCRLRNSTRTFLVSRIHHCADVGTREIVQNIPSYLEGIYLASAVYFANKLLEDHADFLKGLLFIAKADGSMRKKEKDVFIAACNSLVKTSLIDEYIFEKMIEAITVPSLASFRTVIGKLAKQDASIRELFQNAAHEIVGTQKDVSASEKDAIDYIAKRFQTPAVG